MAALRGFLPVVTRDSGVNSDSCAASSEIINERRSDNHPLDRKSGSRKKIWIDLENSPHVPFFKPIIDELEGRGYAVVLTARDCFQVKELADLFGLEYSLVGHHYGKHTIAKLAGLGIRTLQMAPFVFRERPQLALSHGSRSQFLLSSALRIPTLIILDYEHARWTGAGRNSWTMGPEVLPVASLLAMGYREDRILRYPGIKEDVYVPRFRPDPSVRARLGFSDRDLVIIIRPPATEAHYHNPESEKLLSAVLELISQHPESRTVLLPRTPRQEADLRKRWPQLFKSGKIIVPEQVVDGLDLIWCADLVISGGGTMNREAAALGVPVYSIFRGRTGAVDEYLAKTGRLILLQSAEDVAHKLNVVRRKLSVDPHIDKSLTLQTVVNHITQVIELDRH